MQATQKFPLSGEYVRAAEWSTAGLAPSSPCGCAQWDSTTVTSHRISDGPRLWYSLH